MDKRLIVTKDSATNYRYQNSINAFSFAIRGTKEKALQKENAEMRSSRAGSATRRASAFEKAEQNNRWVQLKPFKRWTKQ